MTNVPATAAAAFALLLFAVAMASMANGSLLAAGLSFLSASMVIYFRETRLVDD